MPAADGLPERVRGDARPRRGRFPDRAGRRQRPGRPALHPGHDGGRDELGDPHGLGDRARLPVHRTVASRLRALAQPSPLADRPRRRSRAAEDDRVRPGVGRDEARVRAGLRLRRAGGRLGVHRRRLRRGDRAVGGDEPPGAVGDRPAAGVRGTPGAGAHHDARGRRGVRGARLVRARDADELRTGARAPGPDPALLAGVAQARLVPRPSVAHPPAARRADPEGPDLRARPER